MGEEMIIPAPFLAPPGERTFLYQDQLPSLPVPELQQTLKGYLESVKPFLTESELNTTKRVVRDFGTGIGLTLQDKLLERAQSTRNWLEEWWEKYAYLVTRTPHTPYLVMTSFIIELEISTDQVSNTAMFTWYVVKFWELLRKEKLVIDRGGGKTVWCMEQYHRMFNDCKTPDFNFCQLNHYFKTDREGACPHHMTVLHRGRLFSFDVLYKDGNMITVPEIRSQLQHIVDSCKERERGPGVGMLTAAPRDDWKRLRDHLITIHPNNAEALETLQTSIFVFVLDEGRVPTNPGEELKEVLFGDCKNRWFDKTLGAVAFKNGEIGMWADHSPADAMVAINMVQFIVEANRKNKGLWKGSSEIRVIPKPTEHQFHIDDVIAKGIEEVGVEYLKLGETTQFTKRTSRKYGSNYIKSLGVHPDLVAQLALQLAYYRLHKKPAPTYETASTRAFYHARTDTVRSCTMEAYNWCQAMVNPDITKTVKMKMLNEAFTKHQSLMKQGMRGQNIDRHLLGLQIIAMENGIPMPALYTDPAYIKSGGGGNFILSTSFLSDSHLNGSMVPMCREGYTVFYYIKPNEYQFSASGWVGDDTYPEKLMDEVVESMDLVLDLAEFSKSDANSRL